MGFLSLNLNYNYVALYRLVVCDFTFIYDMIKPKTVAFLIDLACIPLRI